MSPAGLEPIVSANEKPQTYALNRENIGISERNTRAINESLTRTHGMKGDTCENIYEMLF
jgi:hypothetical protein